MGQALTSCGWGRGTLAVVLVTLLAGGVNVVLAQGNPDSLSAAQWKQYDKELHPAPRDTVNQQTYTGWKQYNLNCARCHGEDVQGTTIAPLLITSLKPDGPVNTQELFITVVCAGRVALGMPAWCSLGLGMDNILAIYQYVKGRSEGKIGPGRPAVRPS